MMKTRDARKLLVDHFGDETGAVSFYKGVWTVREGYFYRHGKSEVDLAAKVKRVLPEANVLDSGDHFAAFNGGASLRKSSHFWVKFSV